MSFANISAALRKGYQDGGFGINTSYPNKKPGFTINTQTEWARLSILPAQPGIESLGTNGSDRNSGAFQVDLFYPENKGTLPVLTKSTEIASHFKAGVQFTYSGTSVVIDSCGIQPGFNENEWYRQIINIEWHSSISRI